MNWKKIGTEAKDAIMTGIGYMVPVVVAGALIMAIGKLMAGELDPAAMEGTLANSFYVWGNMLFSCMNWIFAMYIAYRIGNRVALAPGLFAGLFAANSPAGFLGAMIGGLLAGWLIVILNKYLKLPASFQSAKGLIILPFFSCLGVFFAMNYALVPACSWLIEVLTGVLESARGLNPFVFGGILASLVAIGMGSVPGRICFAVALIIMDETGSYMPLTAMNAANGCMLGMAGAILLAKKKFTEEDRMGVASLIAGFICCVTEMQIPYALKDPKRTFPALFIGAFVGGGLVYTFNLEIPVMHGGMLVAVLANNIPLFVLTILITALVTGGIWVLLKPNLPEEKKLEGE